MVTIPYPTSFLLDFKNSNLVDVSVSPFLLVVEEDVVLKNHLVKEEVVVHLVKEEVVVHLVKEDISIIINYYTAFLVKE